MAKIIIGIHGLGNKPPRNLLEMWWKQAICEGLYNINRTRLLFSFELVYWSDILYPKPLDPNVKDKDNPYYLDEPYTHGRSISQPKIGGLRKKILEYTEKQLDKLFFNEDMSLNFSLITDKIIHHYFRDLESYFSQSIIKNEKGEVSARDAICERLSRVLSGHKSKDILLIGHSMGSIIAYDVLSRSIPDIKVHTFVTIGSPLGLPMVINKILLGKNQSKEKGKKLGTPENIFKSWHNFSDIEDKVSIDHTLCDDFEVNTNSVCAVDHLVFNDYVINGNRNPHKSFGYLRAHEVARVIDEFLNKKRLFFPEKWRYRFNGFLYRHMKRYGNQKA